MLLEQEVCGMREALFNERLRREQGNALHLEVSEDYYAGAEFYPSRNVKKARDRQHRQEREEQEQQDQRVERARIRGKQS
jgi:hypothetical protein